MSRAKAPTVEEILAELRACDARPTPGNTTREWAAIWGVGVAKARDVLRELVTRGVMEARHVQRATPLRPGHRCAAVVYVMKDGD